MALPDAASMMPAAAVGLVVIGFAGLMMSRHLYRLLLSLVIAEAGANLLLVMAGYRADAIAPIFTADASMPIGMVDPIPQAMVLTAIVIGVGVQALALAMIIRIRNHYGTLDMMELKARMQDEFAQLGQSATLPSKQEQTDAQ